MSLAQRFGTVAFVVALSAIGVTPAAEAHRDYHHHHHSNKKQKAYNKGFNKGYRKAMRNIRRRQVRPYYRGLYRVYGPMAAPLPQRVIVVPAQWMVPFHPYHPRKRVNVGFGYNL